MPFDILFLSFECKTKIQTKGEICVCYLANTREKLKKMKTKICKILAFALMLALAMSLVSCFGGVGSGKCTSADLQGYISDIRHRSIFISAFVSCAYMMPISGFD